MSAAALLAELHGAGIRLSVHGDKLRVEAPHGAITDALRDRLVAVKPELLSLLRLDSAHIARAEGEGDREAVPSGRNIFEAEATHSHLRTLTAAEGLPATVVSSLPAADVAACTGLPDDTLRAYLHALERGQTMDAGMVPEGYTKPVHCAGCGPVLLWPDCPDHVRACPWCFRWRAGKTVPRPAM